MTKTKKTNIAFLSGLILLGAFTACDVHIDGPRRQETGAAAAPAAAAPSPIETAPPVVVQPVVVVEDTYVYYPGYQIYYNSYRHQYHYREGNVWVNRSAPPQVTAEVVLASPSVRMDFHDAPANHHATIVKQYPKQWAPPGHDRDQHHR